MLLEEVAQRIRGTKELPAMGATGTKLFKMISDPEITMQKIAAVVAGDPPMAVSVMRLANSAAYGFAEATTDLSQAITRIGLRMLKTLVLASAVLSSVRGAGKLIGFDRKSYWDFCLAAAIGARLVANRSNPQVGDDAFLAGLLHGIGITVLDVFFPEELQGAISRVGAENLPLAETIRLQTGLALGHIGSALLAEWSIDASVTLAVASVDADLPEIEPEVAERVHFVRVGIALARAAGIGKPIDHRPEAGSRDERGWAIAIRRLGESMDAIGIEQDRLAEFVEAVQADYSTFAGLAN